MALIDNIILAYNLDGSGSTVTDSHGSLDATSSGTTSVAGLINNARSFTGSETDHIRRTNISAISVSENWSLSLWVKFNNTSNQGIFSNRNGTNDRFAIGLVGGEISVRSYGGAGSDIQHAADTTINNGTWYNIIITHASNNTFLIYIDNSLNISGSGIIYTPPAEEFNIGEIGDSLGDQNFDGLIDMVFPFNVIISSQDRTDLYNSGAGSAYPFSVATLRQIKIAGTFQDKPILTKVSGTFVDKPIKIKVGGTFQDA